MWRLLVFAGLVTAAVCGQALVEDSGSAAATEAVAEAVAEAKDDAQPAEEKKKDPQPEDAAEPGPAKRSPIAATGVYGASGPGHQQPHGHYVVRQAEEVQELAPEYLALLQQYLEAQQQHQPPPPPPPRHQPQPQQHQHQQQQQHVSRARLSALIEQELARLAERPAPSPLKHHQSIPLEVEQYHIETSPQRPIPQQLYYPVEEAQPQAQPHHHQHQHQQQQHVAQHPQPAPIQVHHGAPPQPQPQPSAAVVQQVEAQPQQLRYHQSIPIQYGYEDEQQIREQQQSPESIVRAQAQAEAAALAFQKVAQASHYKHQNEALEQIRLANEKHRQQSALEQIRQGEAVSEAGRQERIQPKDPEGAYKQRLKVQATALVAEQRRAHEAAEYKAHADAILKLQAQQRAHLRAQEEAHRYALNFEKNQQRAQEQAQAVANAQALALYKARQQALAKAQNEAKLAARAQAEARKADPDRAPVVQYLLPNKVPLPAPEVYLPKAEEALRAQAAQAAHEKRLKKPQQPVKHLLLEEIEPQLLRRGPKPGDEQPPQQLTFLVDAGYYRKQQQQQQQHHHQPQAQRALLRPNDYEALEEVQVSPRPRYHQQYHQPIDGEKLALLVPIEPQAP